MVITVFSIFLLLFLFSFLFFLLCFFFFVKYYTEKSSIVFVHYEAIVCLYIYNNALCTRLETKCCSVLFYMPCLNVIS